MKIENSAYQTTTDSSGQYQVNFAPGTFSVVISKDGYESISTQLNVSAATDYPMDRVVLNKPPPAGGVYLQGKDGYIPLTPRAIVALSSQVDFMTSTRYLTRDLTNIDHNAMAAKLEAEVSRLTPQAKLTIADSSPQHLSLVRLNGIEIGTIGGPAFMLKDNFSHIGETTTDKHSFMLRFPEITAVSPTTTYCYVVMGRTLVGQEVPIVSKTNNEARAYCIGGPHF